MPEEETPIKNAHDILSTSASTNTPPRVLNQEQFSPEDELILFAVLQDIAKELRRIKRERQKHQAQAEHEHNPLGSNV